MHWIIIPNIGNINMKYLNDIEAMNYLSHGFTPRSNGFLKGCIGAIGGWLVKIRRPTSWLDGPNNPVPLYSRKGCYALNAQCIVDHRKKYGQCITIREHHMIVHVSRPLFYIILSRVCQISCRV